MPASGPTRSTASPSSATRPHVPQPAVSAGPGIYVGALWLVSQAIAVASRETVVQIAICCHPCLVRGLGRRVS